MVRLQVYATTSTTLASNSAFADWANHPPPSDNAGDLSEGLGSQIFSFLKLLIETDPRNPLGLRLNYTEGFLGSPAYSRSLRIVRVFTQYISSHTWAGRDLVFAFLFI